MSSSSGSDESAGGGVDPESLSREKPAFEVSLCSDRFDVTNNSSIGVENVDRLADLYCCDIDIHLGEHMGQ